MCVDKSVLQLSRLVLYGYLCYLSVLFFFPLFASNSLFTYSNVSFVIFRAVPIDDKMVSTLLKYCEQILLGLNYLTEKGFVHRYLMAKHVLVTQENVCKVCV